jgi:hypothetical protein
LGKRKKSWVKDSKLLVEGDTWSVREGMHGTGAMSLERSRTALEGRDFERVKARDFRDWKL